MSHDGLGHLPKKKRQEKGLSGPSKGHQIANEEGTISG